MHVGSVIPNVFQVQDEEVPIDSIVSAVQKVLDQLTSEQRMEVLYPIHAKEWRAWSNPELLLRPLGLRLEELPESIATSILSVVEATFSPESYQEALAAMRINGFLGDICQMPKFMNKCSYNFLVFGNPSAERPWGWS